MLKILVNECRFDLILSPLDPILIKSGRASVSGPDMAFVKTYRFGEEQIYLPGSSLKGVIRSHGEKIARSLNEKKVCIPFRKEGEDAFCGNKFHQIENELKKTNDKDIDKNLSSEIVYKDSCPICKLFGSTYFIGRFSISDAHLKNENISMDTRDGVGIDRFTGGASRGAKFNMEVVTGGDFIANVYIRNFELWQLGLLGYILRDFDEGLIRIGTGKSRGLGRVRAIIPDEGVTISYTGRKPEVSGLYGIGYYYATKEGYEGYDFVKKDEIKIEDDREWQKNVIRYTKSFKSDIFQILETKWNEYIESPTDSGL
jgi:CRISPR-associated RAMP protein (TIGR02581 family)